MKIKAIGRIFVIVIILFAVLIGVRKNAKKLPVPFSKVITRVFNTEKKDSSSQKPASSLETNILEQLKKLEVKEEEITNQFFLENKRREIKAPIPKGHPDELIIWQISTSTSGTSYNVADCVFNKKKNTHTITFASDMPEKEKVILVISKANRFLSNTAKIAILIEDFNFKANQTTVDFLSFPEPLTISLVPYSKKSNWTAQAANEYKKEIIIHLPFESKIKKQDNSASKTILVHYTPEKIRTIISDAVKAVPNFAGFANLYGSLALEDSRVMNIVLSEIKKHHGYFIDTRISKNSIIPEIAAKKKLPYGEASAKIIEKSDVSAIEGQLKHYAVVAQKRSKILITAKASRQFFKALTNVLPILQQNGVQLVYVSEIVEQPKEK